VLRPEKRAVAFDLAHEAESVGVASRHLDLREADIVLGRACDA
jgi:hypothetical protein